MDRATTWRARLAEQFNRPVDIASLAVWRMLFGLILAWDVWRFFEHGWIRSYYISRAFHFKYFGFEWVEAWPGDGMYWHFLLVGVVALCFALGFCYRVASVLLFLGTTYWFLLDETRYLNHMYMVSLVAFLMMWIPAHRARSLDARLRPSLRSDTTPAWHLWLLRFQVGLVYVYAGVAKLNADWLAAEPISTWLSRRADYPLIGPLLDAELTGWLFAYAGLGFDLAVVPLLLWRRTRPWALAAAVGFHVTNMVLFDIGIFPPMMLAATLLFLEPDWPRRALLFFAPREQPADTPVGPPARDAHTLDTRTRWLRNTRRALLGSYVLLQVLVPLRHFLYPGNVHWTEEGHRFAWHMKLREKRAEASFWVVDARTGEGEQVDARRWLSSKQNDRVGRFPDMALQFAHFLADQYRSEQHPEIEVHVVSKASLNGRPEQLIFDPDVDLAAQPRTLWPAEWVLPLEDEDRRRDPFATPRALARSRASR